MTELPRPTEELPIVVGPYTPNGRTLWIKRHDGTFTDPNGIALDRATYEHLTERCRPASVYGPPEQLTWWADRPGEWPDRT